MKTLYRIFIFVFLFSLLKPAAAQTNSEAANDSIEKAKRNKKAIYSGPRTASIMSAILPGLGQAYNKKFWKIPIIYAGMGGFGYMFVSNNTEYTRYRQFLRAEYDGDPQTINSSGYTGDQLQALKLEHRRYRDFGAMGVGIIYILNIIDANVDAHLKTFDVSDDLSLQIKPHYTIYSTGTGFGPATGITLKLTIK